MSYRNRHNLYGHRKARREAIKAWAEIPLGHQWRGVGLVWAGQDVHRTTRP